MSRRVRAPAAAKRAAALLALYSAVCADAFAQFELATDIKASEIQAVVNAPNIGTDRQIKVVDVGTHNVAVGVLRRGKTTPGAPVTAINHTEVTEVYYMVSGSGTLLTGGTVENSKAAPADSEIVKVDCRSEQQRHLQGAGTEAQARGRRHGDHSRRGLSRLRPLRLSQSRRQFLARLDGLVAPEKRAGDRLGEVHQGVLDRKNQTVVNPRRLRGAQPGGGRHGNQQGQRQPAVGPHVRHCGEMAFDLLELERHGAGVGWVEHSEIDHWRARCDHHVTLAIGDAAVAKFEQGVEAAVEASAELAREPAGHDGALDAAAEIEKPPAAQPGHVFLG